MSVAAQVSMRTNLLHTIPPGKSLTFEISIAKGNISGFTKLQVEVPEGITLKQVENRGGEFEFSESKARIVWVVTSADEQISVRMKLMPVASAMNADFIFKYYYLVDDNKREFESYPFTLHIKDTTLPVFMSASMTELKSRFEPAVPLPAVKAANVEQKSPAEVSQQVAQMRKDAQEALRVGELEKERVNIRMDSINAAISGAESISDSTEKAGTMATLEARRTKNQEDLAVAERVLTLAKSLQGQADEIERLSKERTARPAKAVAAKGKVQSTSSNQQVTAQAPPPEKPARPVPPPPAPVAHVAPAAKAQTVTEPGLVYKIQLGAFKQSPDLLELKKAGEIMLVVENSVYKVLLGSYNSREEAMKRRNELSAQFPGCFIVAYQDGVRK